MKKNELLIVAIMRRENKKKLFLLILVLSLINSLTSSIFIIKYQSKMLENWIENFFYEEEKRIKKLLR